MKHTFRNSIKGLDKVFKLFGVCGLVFENTSLFDLAKSIFGKIKESKSDEKMAVRKRLLFLMMVKKILSEKKRKTKTFHQ